MFVSWGILGTIETFPSCVFVFHFSVMGLPFMRFWTTVQSVLVVNLDSKSKNPGLIYFQKVKKKVGPWEPREVVRLVGWLAYAHRTIPMHIFT